MREKRRFAERTRISKEDRTIKKYFLVFLSKIKFHQIFQIPQNWVDFSKFIKNFSLRNHFPFQAGVCFVENFYFEIIYFVFKVIEKIRLNSLKFMLCAVRRVQNFYLVFICFTKLEGAYRIIRHYITH